MVLLWAEQTAVENSPRYQGILTCYWPVENISAAARAQTGPAAADSFVAPATSLATPGGVRYVVQQAGPGPVAPAGARLAVRYSGYFPNGRLFESSEGKPIRFRLGRHEVIPGWDELLALLPAGTKVRAWIPARLAYAARGVPDPDHEGRYLIPPNTDLIFDLEVVSIR